MVTVHSIHMEDLEDLLIDMVLNRGKPFMRVSILNGNYPHIEVCKAEKV